MRIITAPDQPKVVSEAQLRALASMRVLPEPAEIRAHAEEQRAREGRRCHQAALDLFARWHGDACGCEPKLQFCYCEDRAMLGYRCRRDYELVVFAFKRWCPHVLAMVEVAG